MRALAATLSVNKRTLERYASRGCAVPDCYSRVFACSSWIAVQLNNKKMTEKLLDLVPRCTGPVLLL